jgi:polyhydroxyalkanoate synthesis regulator phasin
MDLTRVNTQLQVFIKDQNRTKVNALVNILEQYHHENMTWLRSIDFFKQENSFLKNRLAEVVDGTTDRGFLAQAEHFQNQFIIKDEFLDEIRHEVNEQERDLTVQFRHQSFSADIVMKDRQQQLRGQMQYLEKEFSNLRYEFNNYLASDLQ